MRVENTMFIILGLCLLICLLFWRQLPPSPELSPPGSHTTAPRSIYGPPSPPPKDPFVTVELPSGRDVFKLPWTEDKEPVSRSAPTLSTIFWNDHLPLAIIKGEILKKGDKDSKSQFRVETITRDKVRIRFIADGKEEWLTPGTE